ncbi:MAG: preprotein translocase subunit YajC [Nannocystis sp.]|nr:preprotein translocase subunit YajC [Nannocystis sp.]MBA3545178.1 preprotein translocase subunit YajC [Nannocystis sp.]
MLATPTLSLLAEAAAPTGGGLTGFLPIILMVAVFYFLVIRPASKQEKDRKARLSKLDKGDQVRLTGGILGKVVSIEDQIVFVEIADKVKIRVLKAEIGDKWEPPVITPTVVKADGAEVRS